ncbi:MAG: PAS domain-containing protein [Alphaproteobacteria bacterium]|nr:PAS domain-containing protein [Alphaproteobacteria bacterium]
MTASRAITDLADELEIQITHPITRRLLGYWRGLRGTLEFPTRGDIDPVEFPYALGHCSLIEVYYQPLRFRFRLVGTLVSQRLSMELTGRWLHDVPMPEYRQALEELYRKVISSRRPQVYAGPRRLDGRDWHAEALILPLGDDRRDINMLLACRVYRHP